MWWCCLSNRGFLAYLPFGRAESNLAEIITFHFIEITHLNITSVSETDIDLSVYFAQSDICFFYSWRVLCLNSKPS